MVICDSSLADDKQECYCMFCCGCKSCLVEESLLVIWPGTQSHDPWFLLSLVEGKTALKLVTKTDDWPQCEESRIIVTALLGTTETLWELLSTQRVFLFSMLLQQFTEPMAIVFPINVC